MDERTQSMLSRVRMAATQTDRNPSQAQVTAGNYSKGRFWWNGHEISIENPRGSVRSGVSKSGKTWAVRMPCHYGYIRRTVSKADGDAVDVMIGPNPASDLVCVVDQQNPGGRFDEHKAVLGCSSLAEAKRLYLSCYSPGWTGLKSITAMTRQQFLAWLEKGDTGKPIDGQVSMYERSAASVENQPRDDHGRWTDSPTSRTSRVSSPSSRPSKDARKKHRDNYRKTTSDSTERYSIDPDTIISDLKERGLPSTAWIAAPLSRHLDAIDKALSGDQIELGASHAKRAMDLLQRAYDETKAHNDAREEKNHETIDVDLDEMKRGIESLRDVVELKRYLNDQKFGTALKSAGFSRGIKPGTGNNKTQVGWEKDGEFYTVLQAVQMLNTGKKTLYAKGDNMQEKYDRTALAAARYAAVEAGERWITINGGSKEDGEGGGTPVKIDGHGNITAGPKGIADKGIKKLSDFGKKKGEGKTDSSPQASTPPAASPPASPKYFARGNTIFDANGVRHGAFRNDEKARDAAERWNKEGKPGEQKQEQMTHAGQVEKPPKSLPETGDVEYRGFKLSKSSATQVGYGGKGRKASGVTSIDPEGTERFHGSLREAIAKVSQWHGDDNSPESVQSQTQPEPPATTDESPSQATEDSGEGWDAEHLRGNPHMMTPAQRAARNAYIDENEKADEAHREKVRQAESAKPSQAAATGSFSLDSAKQQMDRRGYASHGDHKVKVVPHAGGGTGDSSTYAVEHYKSSGGGAAERTTLPEQYPTIEQAQEAAINHLRKVVSPSETTPFSERYQSHTASGKDNFNATLHALSDHLKSKGADVSPGELNSRWSNHHIGSINKNSTDDQIKAAFEASRDNKPHTDEWWMNQSPTMGGNFIAASKKDEEMEKRRANLLEHASGLESDAKILKALGSDKADGLSAKAAHIRKQVESNRQAYKSAIDQEKKSEDERQTTEAEQRRWKAEPNEAKPLTPASMARTINSIPRYNFAKMLQETGWYSDQAFAIKPPEKVKEQILTKSHGTSAAGRYPDIASMATEAGRTNNPPMKSLGERSAARSPGEKKRPGQAGMADHHTVMADDDGRHVVVDSNYVRTIQKMYPKATFHSPDREHGPVVVKSGSDVVGLLMPLGFEKGDKSTKETEAHVKQATGAKKVTRYSRTDFAATRHEMMYGRAPITR